MNLIEADDAFQARIRRDATKVLGYCRRWGVSVVRGEHAPDNDKDYHHGPTGETAICWPRREIIWRDPKIESDVPNLLLHELGHCLSDSNPKDVDEVNGMMLAFEYHSHRWLRVSGWSEWMHEYEAGDKWSYLSQAERHQVLDCSRRAAIVAGVLSRELKPTFKRPVWVESRA